MFRTLGMYNLLFRSTPSPSPAFASAEWGPSHAVPPVGSPREHRRAWPLGTSFPVGHWPRHPVLVASPPTDMLRRLSSLGYSRPGGSVVRPATLEVYPGAMEGCAAAALPRSPFPQGPCRFCVGSYVSSSTVISTRSTCSCLCSSPDFTRQVFHHASILCQFRVIRCNSVSCATVSV